MKINNLFVPALLVACMSSACVSTQKYNDMQTARDHYKAEYENSKALQKENEELTNQLRMAENQVAQLKGDLINKVSETARLDKEKKEIATRFEDVSKENARLLSSYSTEKTVFEERLATNEDELALRERQLQGLENTIGLQSYNMESMRTDLSSREKRVAELEKLLIEKDAQMAQLRTSLDAALRGFSTSDLAVKEQNGKIYVSLSQNLLFKTNSDAVEAKGQEALEQLAVALIANPGIEVVVEGHTDNSGSVNYNWDLSARRATAIVKSLSLAGVDPARLTAAARGMHHPLVPNNSEANKAKNRRTEIILSPNLDKLYELSK